MMPPPQTSESQSKSVLKLIQFWDAFLKDWDPKIAPNITPKWFNKLQILESTFESPFVEALEFLGCILGPV